MAAEEPLVRPNQDFDPIKLNRESLPELDKSLILDPYARFVTDRFKTMTASQQANLLATLDRELINSDQHLTLRAPFQFNVMREQAGIADLKTASHEQLAGFYLDYSALGRRFWLERALRDTEMRTMAGELAFEELAKDLPSIAFTLAHIYEGGHYGFLTARGSRENHTRQVEVLSESIGFAPVASLVYYVNDEVLGRRLNGNSSSDRKGTVLVNFATGLKESEGGSVVPMSHGKFFDTIIVIDDEDKNLKSFMTLLIRDVCSNVLYEAGMRFRTDGNERRISDKAKEITEKFYPQRGVDILQDPQFWTQIVDSVLSDFTKQSGKFVDRESLINKLKKDQKWLPDVLTVLDARTIDAKDCITRLRTSLQSGQPLEPGSKRSLLLNDIDGTLLVVDALFHVSKKSDLDQTALLTINQAQFAEHPTPDYWIKQVAQETGFAPADLDFSFAHFRDSETIERDILKAMHRGAIWDQARGPKKAA